MASARSCSGRAPAGCPRSRRIRARLFRAAATRGWSGRRRPRGWPARVLAAAGPLRLPQVPQDQGQVVQGGGDVGVVRAVGGLGDGQRAFLQRPGPLRLPQVPQDQGQVVQASGDVGVVRAVGGLGDGQRTFLQRPGLLRLPQVPQDQGQVVQAGGDVGVVRAVGGLMMASARSSSALASVSCACTCR